MTNNSLEATCRDCGKPVSFHAGETRPARCSGCFDGFMLVRDADFLSSYAELGVTSRRILAETSFRSLVLESPPHRKVLAMHIMEQYVHATSDLVGLYYALKQRGRQPIMRAFLDFRLDRATALAFFNEIATTPHHELLAALGLPVPDDIAARFPSLSKSDVRDLRNAMVQMLGDVKRASEMGESAALALAQMAGESRSGAALAKQTAWLDNVGLRPDQVASIAIDSERRTISVAAISVDEKRLEHVVSAIGAMTHISSTLVYAVLTSLQEDERAKQGEAKRRRARPSPT
jgi:hypothetical protein